jgi:succinate dehydrogenase flavin-adding protein (antitoxin of CptAB toxin-antitoxin module)
MDIELPSEIWREILSYNSLPICRRVCRLLYYIEENLTEDRINNISTRYESSLSRCLEAEDWDASILVMNTYNQKDR